LSAIEQYRIKARGAAELARELEALVAAGALQPGQRLPSVRRLAAQVGLSPATVATAVAELRRRGVVVSEPRRGVRIGSGPQLGAPVPAMPVPEGARDLSRGNPDPDLLPDLRSALAEAHAAGRRLYGEPQALAELLELAARQLAADGVPGDHLCVLSGAMDAIERVAQAHLRPGDRVAVENPGYAALYDVLRAQALELEPVPVDQRGMLPAELERALARGARAVVITPRGQNPTGAALDADRARELRAVLAQRPAALVIEDDHLGPLAGVPAHTLLRGAAESRQRWAVTRSVAKALGPDLRLAVLAGDAHTIARVQGRQQRGPGWVSHILQATVLELWRDPSVHELVERASATYARRRELLLERLSEHGLPATGASGLNVWLAVPEEASVIGALMQRGWVLAPGAPHRLHGAGPAVRITISTLLEPEAERLARDLADVLAAEPSRRAG